MKSLIKIATLISLIGGSNQLCHPQNPLDDVNLDPKKLYAKPKRINKKNRVASFTLPLYRFPNDSPFMPMIKSYIRELSYEIKKCYKDDNIFSVIPPASYIHFRDDLGTKGIAFVIAWMNGEQDKMYPISNVHFEGVLFVDNHYFLLTEAVASFFKKDHNNSKITFECPYIEYDLHSEDRKYYEPLSLFNAVFEL